MMTTERPRVAHFIGSHHNFTGTQRSTHVFLRHIDRTRYDPCVVAPGEGACLEHFRALGLPVVVEPAPPPLDRFNRFLMKLPLHAQVQVALRALLPYSVRLARRLQRMRIRIVHTSDLRGQLLAAPAARLMGASVVAHYRGEFTSLPRSFVAAGTALADRAVVVSPNVWRGIPSVYRGRCLEIRDPVMPPPARPIPRREDVLASLSQPIALGPDDVLLAVVGTLVTQKGAHRLLEALRAAVPALQRAVPARRLGVLLIGNTPDEPYRRLVEERVAAWGLVDVRVLGWVPDELVDRVYRVADIACFPGVQRETLDVYGDVRAVHCTDALPRGVMEPMSYGVAVVATGVAGIEKVVEDRKTGLLVRPSDPDALAAAIVELATQPDIRARLARAGKTFIEDACSVSAHLDQMMALYDDLLRSPPPSRSRLWS